MRLQLPVSLLCTCTVFSCCLSSLAIDMPGRERKQKKLTNKKPTQSDAGKEPFKLALLMRSLRCVPTGLRQTSVRFSQPAFQLAFDSDVKLMHNLCNLFQRSRTFAKEEAHLTPTFISKRQLLILFNERNVCQRSPADINSYIYNKRFLTSLQMSQCEPSFRTCK